MPAPQAAPRRTSAVRTVVRTTAGLAAGLTSAALCTGALAPQPATAASTEPQLAVVVRALPGAAAAAGRVVHAAGGRVQAQLPVIGGFAATTTAAGVARLRRTPGVLAVTPDAPVHLSSVEPGLGAGGTEAQLGSLYDVTRLTRAQEAWRAGFTGRGVDVALIDSGVAPVAGLTSGNVVVGPDLSFDSQDPGTASLDAFGHGTHMAGIIAGRDAVSSPAGYADPTRFTGVAPDSRLVSIKVAAHDGATDVSQVIAAIDWVTQHAKDPGFNIRVLNLSFGTDSTQDARLDPLVHAAEAAWQRGVVVVVAGGNEGAARPLLSDPAMSPQVLAVGAQDPHGTLPLTDDTVPDFASRGSWARHVDLVAPGMHVVSLAVPGSAIATDHADGLVGTRFLKGSGTSQATAITSAAAALYLQKYPAATPAQVKRALMQSASPLASAGGELVRGAGALDVKAALALAPAPTATDRLGGTGTGTLEGSRGTSHVADGGVELTGEKDVFGKPFRSATWAPLATAGRSWTGGTWNGSTWTGAGWSGSTWANALWSGTSWTGTPWAGRTWTGRTWTGTGWSDGTWDGRTWTGRTWTGRTWTGRTWTGGAWE